MVNCYIHQSEPNVYELHASYTVFIGSKEFIVFSIEFDSINVSFIATDVMTLLSMTPKLGRCRR